MNVTELINKKANGKELTENEINFLIENYTNNKIPDYQFSSLLMAIRIKGMSKREIQYLTQSYIDSGDIVDFKKNFVVDKHSTGGVGDKTSIILTPLMASLGIKVGKISGRGLGFTGGTVDKLESIKGFSIELSKEQFIANTIDKGISLIGQLPNLTPADKKIYALRDVTSTVQSMPLITASIMSKKLANGASMILLDVKTGKGSLNETLKDARTLAKEMNSVAKLLNRKAVSIITNMNEPLGHQIGNANEIEESVETLRGNGPSDLENLCIFFAAKALVAKEDINFSEAKKLAKNNLYNGKAYEKFLEWIKLQGGQITEIEKGTFFKPQNIYEIKATSDGYINIIDASQLGMIVIELGGGRKVKEDKIDYQVGIKLIKKQSDKVKKNDLIAKFYYNNKTTLDKIKNLENVFFDKSVNIVKKKPKKSKTIIEIIE